MIYVLYILKFTICSHKKFFCVLLRWEDLPSGIIMIYMLLKMCKLFKRLINVYMMPLSPDVPGSFIPRHLRALSIFIQLMMFLFNIWTNSRGLTLICFISLIPPKNCSEIVFLFTCWNEKLKGKFKKKRLGEEDLLIHLYSYLFHRFYNKHGENIGNKGHPCFLGYSRFQVFNGTSVPEVK